MSMNEGTLLIQSIVAQSITNLDSSQPRARNPSRETRKEGWTEVWGKSDLHSDSGQGLPVCIDSSDAPTTAETSQTQPKLILTQFKPAWFEQLILRMAGITHTIINSKYAATEATGPLPCLRHGTALVGRHHPYPHHTNTSTTIPTDNVDSQCNPHATPIVPNNHSSKNHILNYLQEYCNEFDLHIPHDKRAQSHLLVSLITDKLQPALQVLTFADQNAWEQLYRPQYLKASSGSPLGARFQTWSLRVMTTKKYNHLDLATCKADVRECYDTLEMLLEQNATTGTLLGTSLPTTTDALLWAHLADALSDVYIVNILIDYPRMATFFQSIYQKYFLDFSTTPTTTKDGTCPTIEIVGDNCFLLPLEQSRNHNNYSSSCFDYTTSLELMQSLRPDLRQLLATAKEIRQGEIQPSHKSRDLLTTWCLGGDLFEGSRNNNKNNRDKNEPTDESSQQQKLRKEHKTNDELWISSVVGVTALILIFGQRLKSA
jgi:hypothetical protein